MGTLLHSCVKVREAKVVSGIGLGIGVLDGVDIPKEKREVWVFSPPGLNGVFECIFKTEMYLTRGKKLKIFLYRQYINGIAITGKCGF